MERTMSEFGRFSTVLAVLMLLSDCTFDRSDRGHAAKHKAYQATYSCPGNFAYQTSHIYRNGVGHIRIDISGQRPTIMHILNQKTDETIAWTEKVNKYIRR